MTGLWSPTSDDEAADEVAGAEAEPDSASAIVVESGVTVEAPSFCDFTGELLAVNNADTPVEVFVEAWLYSEGTLIEVDSAYWNLSTGWQGVIGTLSWAEETFDFEELECFIHEVRVRDRG